MAHLADVIIVSGAASGIGRASALYFLECGATVVAVDRDADGLATLRRPGLHVTEADLTQEAACEQVTRKAAQLGRVKGLFNCAGVELHGTVVTMSEVDWRRTMDVNLNAIFFMSKFAIPLMVAAGGGAIVNMSSIQALATQTDVAAYAAAKGAVLSLTRAMALDHGRQGIRVNAICPGTIETPLVQANARHFNPDNPGEQLAAWGNLHALGRIGQPIEVARLAAFLLSDDASFVTGSAHLIDGGLLASF